MRLELGGRYAIYLYSIYIVLSYIEREMYNNFDRDRDIYKHIIEYIIINIEPEP